MAFTKRDTQVAKGVAIVLMVFHHLFFDSGAITDYDIVFPVLGSVWGYTVAQLSKICVFVFVFLSAYGITKSWMSLSAKEEDSGKVNLQMTQYSYKRCINILSGYVFIFVIVYVLAWAFPGTVRSLPYPPELYGTGVSGLCYTVMDMLGLAFLWRGPTANPEWWYVSVALLLVFVMPSFIRWYQKAGIATYIVAALLANWIYMLDREGMGHLTALPLGIAFARNDWFVKMRLFSPIKGESAGAKIGNKLTKIAISGTWFMFFMQFAASGISFYVGYQLATVALIYLCYEVVSGIPGVGTAFAFLGKHAMNIYFTHTFIIRSFREYVYRPRYAPLVLLALLAGCLLLSVLLEGIKKWSRYNKLATRLAGVSITGANKGQ